MARRCDAQIDQTASSASPSPPCYPSFDSLNGVETHLTGGSIGCDSGDVGNPDGYLGIVGYDYCTVSEVIRAAKSKGVRLLKSDLIDDESERINQGVVVFRGIRAQLVDAIYDGVIGGSAIEEILQTLRSRNLSHDGILRHGEVIERVRQVGEVRHNEISLDNVIGMARRGQAKN